MSVREDVTFASQGTSVAAWLYRPDGDGGAARPVIVMAHGLGGVREMRLDAFAERFAEAGYACLVFDYRHFGASDGQPRQLLSVRRQRQDWAAAVAFARTLPGVDASRTVLWGSSFSGGHVIAVAADDPSVAAVVSQCPYTDGLASSLAVAPFTSLRVTLRALRDLVGSWFGRRPRSIPLAGEPGTVALMTAPDAVPGYLALVEEGSTFRNEVAARVALDIALGRPGAKARRLRCPALFVVCERDTVAPARATLKHVERAPRGEVVRRDAGHFDIYVGEEFETTVRDELAFLRRHVPAT
ncbi:pimeloyl-ACP methyl ester carboxylesterase [Aeromicrobium sp. SORGH_AS981]|uniref:alpha/beta hydrolase n=1 Tax=Aeromicrobium sp. SORGH_AS_0981 TaxID=3041802 RepID=UPI0028587077|nr:alpha/beta fold hydrolase [Aeromicrobium sp. SORGH_AS_0981]MDR6120166.1 pimeloyl-ACP methyl ester carboxylesterase [Aeromicrobium sp. SORGH_AS_0981]